ncbi:MAG: hypothetical protein NVS4B3_23970 [Gemmatimonadaceae bacterium]
MIGPRAARIGRLALVGSCFAACGGPPRTAELRQWTDDLAFRISSEPQPPRAREKILYKVIITDRKSGQPIQTGEGRLFATSRDAVNVWDILERGPAVCTSCIQSMRSRRWAESRWNWIATAQSPDVT